MRTHNCSTVGASEQDNENTLGETEGKSDAAHRRRHRNPYVKQVAGRKSDFDWAGPCWL